jgi:hypothetical protein
MIKHTPGPWSVEDNDRGEGKSSHPNQIMTAKGDGICEMYHDMPERAANELLIAAAPELLEALKVALLANEITAAMEGKS